MNRTTRIRKVPNRDPVSLAATTTPTTTQNEVIDTIEVVAINPNLDPALASTPTSTSIPTLESLDTNTSFNYPSPPRLNRAISWSAIPTPPPLPAPASQPRPAIAF